ncbi:hypothetical protein [uncultured Paracoccus sp.]|uniref:hypothetical protein n=1 Tax=Paracoccus sp. S1E-3 TaxID=2756130 RepID=UPI00345CBB73
MVDQQELNDIAAGNIGDALATVRALRASAPQASSDRASIFAASAVRKPQRPRQGSCS